MAEQPSGKPLSRWRDRPSHWRHPVDEHGRERRARQHRRRRIVLAVLALVVVGLAATYWTLTSDERVEQFAEQYLEDLFGADVSIQRASFDLWEGALVLEDLRITPPPPFSEPIVEAAQVDLRIDMLALAAMRVEVTEIIVRRPAVTLVLWDEYEWNFQRLAQMRPPGRVPPAVRPVVALADGTLRIKRKVAGEAIYDHQMQVSGLLMPDETDPDAFRFQTDVTSAAMQLSVASGWLNMRTGALRFEGQASNVALTPDLYSALPREAQRIWDRFEPTGSVNLKILFDEAAGFRLGADLTGVSFSYTYQAVAHRFEDLTGRAIFSREALVLEGIQGVLDGMPAHLSGRVTGFDAESLGADLSVWAGNVDLEEKRSVLEGVAPHLAAIYDQYQPKGRVDVAVRLQREPEADAPVRTSGSVFCRDAEMTYFRFPYRLEHLQGTVGFGPEGFEIDRLKGRHGPATVELTGYARNPGPRVDALVEVRASGVQFDDDLRSALAPAQREVYDRYSITGQTDLEATIRRPPEEGARLEVTIQADLDGCSLQYEEFPYRLTEAHGRVRMGGGRTEIERVVGRHGPAEVAVEGEIVASADGPAAVRLRLDGRDIPVDQDLEAALPERERRTLRAFHLSGPTDIRGTVTRGPETEGRLAYDLQITLKGTRMIYEAFPFLAEDVTGSIHLTPDACRIEHLAGTNSGARIEARGWVEQQVDDYALDVEITGRDVLLDTQLRGALGPQARSAWQQLAPSGRVDIRAHLTKALGKQEAMKHHVWVTAHGASARLEAFPYPLEEVSGILEFEGDEVRLQNVEARNGPTGFLLNGWLAYGETGVEMDLAVQARDVRLEGPLRRALPGALGATFDALAATGRMDLSLERLHYRRTGPDQFEAEWTGTALLDEVSLAPGAKIANVVGTAEMRGSCAEGRLALDGSLWIQQGKIADKDVSNMRLVFHKEADSPDVIVPRIEGEFYDGRVEGSGRLALEPPGRYGFSIEADGLDFERFLREGFRLEHNITGGRMRATLALRAVGPQAEGVEASGYAHITDARLYELPPVVRILNLLRLAPPDRTAFREAEVWYFVRGKRLILGDIRLLGRAMNLYGAGTIEPDGQLALSFLPGKKDDDPLVPALAEMIEGVRHELVLVEVRGTIAEPDVRLRSFTTLSAPLRELAELVRRSQRTP
jgi:hypothetical protein